MGNWEWLALAGPLTVKHKVLVLYKTLANKKINQIVVTSRERLGSVFITVKGLRTALKQSHERPFFLALLSDQAPHDYSKAFEVPFLNRPTFFVPGPGMFCAQKDLQPVFGWIKRVGRSRYLFRFEALEGRLPVMGDLTSSEQEQVIRVSKANRLSEEDGVKAFAITKKFAERLEAEIKMAPQDWLWSHRRWKIR